ncbi:AMP-binding protein [Natrinema halophilum]|uniref:AMP-binding protein n=1 Tax=Natrinema halophilum TaxID=1699371 RepID=UPI001F3CFB01|nr:AMP-binding protein [Natrinema halophilum]UHQ96312.1 AMP-binding protein [Natrinema halophilum]
MTGSEYTYGVSAETVDFPDGIPDEPDYPLGKVPVHQYLRHHARNQPDSVAINYYGREISYREWDRFSDRLATHLAAQGYSAGDVLLLYLPNCPQLYIGYYAAYKLGMIAVPCDPLSKTYRLKYQIEDTGANVILAHDSLSDVVESVVDEVSIRDVIYTRYETFLPDEPAVDIHESMSAATQQDRKPTDEQNRYLASVFQTTQPDPPEVDVSMDDTATLVYTGGTTGLPKGCEHTHETMLIESVNIATVWEFNVDDRHLATLPIYHIGGKCLSLDAVVIHGGTVILMTRYDPETMMALTEEYRPTRNYMTTSIVNDILDHPDRNEYDLTSFKYSAAVSFSEKLTEQISDEWTELTGSRVLEGGYGFTEAHNGVTFTNRMDIVEEGFVGLPHYGGEIVIRDPETGEELPRGEEGEIMYRGPSLLKGYWNNPEATADALEDGWFLTGDIGYLDDDGYLYYLGRQKNLIKYSGYQVVPEEVELVLQDNEHVENSAVAGKTHPEKGEEPVAFVELSDESVTEEEIIEWAKERLAPYKRPRTIAFVDAVPTTEIGKTDRTAIDEMADDV